MKNLVTYSQSQAVKAVKIKPRKRVLLPALVFAASMLVNTVHAESHTQAVDSNAPITSLKNLTSITTSGDTKVNTPVVVDFKTSNGTRVLLVQANELPIVDIRITFNAGSARDPWITRKYKKPLQGVASLTANMLNKGTSGTVALSENDIATLLEDNGLSFSAKAYKDMFAVSMRSLSAEGYVKQASELMANVLANASFPEANLTRVKAQQIIGLRQAAERPSSMANVAFSKALYGKHPYALPSSGTLKTVPNIERKHLVAFKNKFLVAKNASIAITGKLSVQAAKMLAEQITQSLPTGKKAAKLPKPRTPKRQHIHIPFDSNQTTIIAGQLGIARKDSKAFDLSVANSIFGGGDFQALLMNELRKKRGLTYGAYSAFTPMQTTGPFRISFSTRNDKAKTALKVTKKTLRNYLRKGATSEQINETKLSMVNQFPLSMATNANINAMLAMMAFYDMPKEYIEDYTLNLLAVTKHSANKAFQRKISSRKLVVVTVGPNKP